MADQTPAYLAVTDYDSADIAARKQEIAEAIQWLAEREIEQEIVRAMHRAAGRQVSAAREEDGEEEW